MPTTILDLPNEVLAEVSKLLARDSTSLHVLTLTCQRISTIAHDVLYEDIHLDYIRTRKVPQRILKKPASAIVPAEPSQPELLLRTWREKPTLLLQKLKTFTLSAGWASGDLPQLLMALSRARNLKSLEIQECPNSGIEEFAAASQRLLWDRFPSLQSLDLDTVAKNVTSSTLILLFTHHSLRTIRIGSSTYGETPKPDLAIPGEGGSGLTNVDISHSLIDSTSLEPILLAAPQLQSLQINLPQDMVAFENPFISRDDGDDRLWSNFEHLTLDPHELGKRLWPVHQSLRTLAITNPLGIVMNYADTQIDLSAFECLQDLRISSVLLLGDVSYMIASVIDFVPLLPPNLIRLHVCFDTLQGIFYSIDNLETACTKTEDPGHLGYAELWETGPGDRSLVATCFGWLNDLASRCEKLECLDLEETHERSSLIRRREGKAHIHEKDSFRSINVVPRYPLLFAGFPFRCRISIYVDVDSFGPYMFDW